MGKRGLSLTSDGQGSFAFLLAGHETVPPGLGLLHVLEEEPVHEAVLLDDQSVLGAELETGHGGAGHPQRRAPPGPANQGPR